ncbi:hypothetical protein P168DRAFT_287212 [Aspergillus campestris IBT 28561]|uniref:Uncharacterized protein n=1 Tax=Aspergillus campestris (strain IBT 28561) TaxID=1392248 RepID=A0A2I1DGZ1_ASPC2|nr:uncharacterized protein P168DRAFT_287212 [Aspergillus campestris IBT 28561]PKY09136.1 hypothetical protein P168DRAFT_287212 [Aspergillus campestris IBT 28561]
MISDRHGQPISLDSSVDQSVKFIHFHPILLSLLVRHSQGDIDPNQPFPNNPTRQAWVISPKGWSDGTLVAHSIQTLPAAPKVIIDIIYGPIHLKKKEPPIQSKKGTKRIKRMKKRKDRSTKTTGSPTVEHSSHQPDRRMGARSWYREKGEVDSPAAHMTAAGG